MSCGYNQFVEACFLHWLSDGRQPNGMVLRMQGFDEGVFGGHFHTANAPPVFGIPGLDVFAYSNGHDWARGLRAAVRHATNGGVSMLLDSTALLARKHLIPAARDDGWQFEYPHSLGELSADDVVLYPYGASPAGSLTVSSATAAGMSSAEGGRLVVVTYGNGVPKSLEAIETSGIPCDLIDVPLLSRCPEALPPLLRASRYSGMLLVDVCRQGAGPLAHLASQLHDLQALPARWRTLSATPTYNPLGRTLTFTSPEDIGTALAVLSEEVNGPDDESSE